MAAFNKNSQYIQSLVDYVLDTKPYHSKLTEIVEEYQFFDSMHVHFEEREFVRTKIDPTWLYNYYSGGDTSLRSFPLKQLHSPLASIFSSNAAPAIGAIKAQRDENTDLALVPFVYSKKAFDGIGVADVLVERAGNRARTEALVEGLDWFQSHGSIQLQIKQTSDANTNFVPSWSETRDDNVIATASAYTRQLANDATNPASAVSQIKALLLEIKTIIDAGLAGSTHIAEYQQANAYYGMLMTRLAIPLLPRKYEGLLNNLITAGATPPAGFTDWLGDDTSTHRYVSDRLSSLTPSMYFNTFSDAAVQESGQAGYDDVVSPWLTLSTVNVTPAAVPGDTWSVIAQDSHSQLWAVFSGIKGYIGSFTATPGGVQFVSSTINFRAFSIAQPTENTTLKIKNRNRLVFGPDAPRETWNIIKVNPLAYTRPFLTSTRYGYISDTLGNVGYVTILDQTIPTSTIILTARANGGIFDLSSTIDSSYTGVVTVNVPFNDGHLAFTITSGTVAPFVAGDRFYIDIENDVAFARDFDLGYGYDLESYDNADYKDDTGVPLNWVYDTRFTDYDVANMNLIVDQDAIDGRKWRITAIPDLLQPIATRKKDGSGPSNWVDLQESTTGVAPDVPLNSIPLYANNGDIEPDLMVYRASTFRVEYSDDNFNTFTNIGIVSVGGHFTSSLQGIQFDLPVGSKPFLGVRAFNNDGINHMEGGDIFTFTVVNPKPVLTEAPIGLTSSTIPRLIMNGDGFHEVKAAKWGVTFSSNTNYIVSGIQTEGSIGTTITDSPVAATLSTPGAGIYEGNSFNDLGVHFTIVPGSYGLDAGDKFTFDTFSRKPSYLVHGSVSGWQVDAVVGETYWNGIIGFVLDKPTVQLYDSTSPTPRLPRIGTADSWAVGSGTLELTRLRFDAENSIYTLIPTPIGQTATGWYVYKDTSGAVGHLPLNGSFSDKYITLKATNVPAASAIILKLEVTADDFMLWNAQDTVILRPKVAARLPASTDFVLVDKRTSDRLAINLDYDSVALPPSMAALAPETTDVRFIDTYTGATGTPLANTSPETAIVRNFLPLTITPYDSNTSIAEFSDRGVSFDITSAASGQSIGTVRTTSSNPNTPVEFEFDLAFFSQYLPLNASANVITFGSGFNEIVNVRMRESLKFLVDGGALSTDYLFRDTATVHVSEDHSWSIFTAMEDAINASIEDGPFGGFLPGYDNVPFDDVGTFGIGVPFTDYFHQAQALAKITSRTISQQRKLDGLLIQLNGYIENGILNTTLPQFLAHFEPYDGDPTSPTYNPTGYTSTLDFDPILTGIGFPARGMGMDITIGGAGADATKPSTEGVGAAVQDALVVMAIDTANTLEQFGLDIGGLDSQAERTALIYSGSLPPVPSSLTMAATYAEFETPLAVVRDPSIPNDFEARVFEIAFNISITNKAAIMAMPNPRIFIWLPTQASPQEIAVVDKVGTGRYRVSVPAATEAKLYLQPGS